MGVMEDSSKSNQPPWSMSNVRPPDSAHSIGAGISTATGDTFCATNGATLFASDNAPNARSVDPSVYSSATSGHVRNYNLDPFVNVVDPTRENVKLTVIPVLRTGESVKESGDPIIGTEEQSPLMSFDVKRSTCPPSNLSPTAEQVHVESQVDAPIDEEATNIKPMDMPETTCSENANEAGDSFTITAVEGSGTLSKGVGSPTSHAGLPAEQLRDQVTLPNDDFVATTERVDGKSPEAGVSDVASMEEIREPEKVSETSHKNVKVAGVYDTTTVEEVLIMLSEGVGIPTSPSGLLAATERNKLTSQDADDVASTQRVEGTSPEDVVSDRAPREKIIEPADVQEEPSSESVKAANDPINITEELLPSMSSDNIAIGENTSGVGATTKVSTDTSTEACSSDIAPTGAKREPTNVPETFGENEDVTSPKRKLSTVEVVQIPDTPGTYNQSDLCDTPTGLSPRSDGDSNVSLQQPTKKHLTLWANVSIDCLLSIELDFARFGSILPLYWMGIDVEVINSSLRHRSVIINDDDFKIVKKATSWWNDNLIMFFMQW
jgi:hypothetical protein